MESRKHFSSQLGFILATAGSAVGLGNLWRFPYLAAKYGGGGFLLIYLILVVTFGFTLMITEIALGRKTGLSALHAFKALNKKSHIIGVLASIVPIIILPYYCVIGGWVVKFTVLYLFGGGKAAVDDSFFGGFISQPVEPLVYLAIFVLLTTGVILLGVNKGIEQFSKILMPILVLLSIGIAVFVALQPGSKEGIIYYLKPDPTKITLKTFLAASGQMFYSMSLAMGIMITYGSYVTKTENIESCVRSIELFDTLIAILAGFMIIPAVFVFSGGDAAALGKGPTLMFCTLPKVFDSMFGGQILAPVFFFLVLFAALTSSISLMETVISIFEDKFPKKRNLIAILVTVYTLLMAVPSSLGFGIWDHIGFNGYSILDLFDFVSNNLLMPVVAILTCVFVGYILKPKAVIDEVELSGQRFKSHRLYVVIIKFVAPIILAMIFVSSILEFFGIIKI
ncbi:MAG: sodium-dependent transporter [Acetatifactor sp.]